MVVGAEVVVVAAVVVGADVVVVTTVVLGATVVVTNAVVVTLGGAVVITSGLVFFGAVYSKSSKVIGSPSSLYATTLSPPGRCPVIITSPKSVTSVAGLE